MAWRIFSHAIRMLLRNLGPALRVSLPVILVAAVGVVLFGGLATAAAPGSTGVAAGAVLWGIAYIVATLWTAVAWHRFVLLEEPSAGLLPPFAGRAILGYVVASVVMSLLGIAGSVFVASIAMLFASIGADVVAVAAAVVSSIALIWALQRVALILPAAAVGRRLRLAQAWHATAPVAFAIVLVYLMYFACLFGVGLAVELLGLAAPVLGIAASAVFQWIATMAMLSILTTLYGICIEERALP